MRKAIVDKDPTYNREEIRANPIWERAFQLSEELNDVAPLGWGHYIPQASRELGKQVSPDHPDSAVVSPKRGKR